MWQCGIQRPNDQENDATAGMPQSDAAIEIAMDKARYDAILCVKENENQNGGEEKGRQIARSRGWLIQRANVARDVDDGESPAHNA